MNQKIFQRIFFSLIFATNFFEKKYTPVVGKFLRRKPHKQGLGKALPNNDSSTQRSAVCCKMSAEANFGTVVESCSMKPTLSPSSFPFAPYTTEKCKIAKLPAILFLPLTRMRRAFTKRGKKFFFRIRNTGGTIFATAEIKKQQIF